MVLSLLLEDARRDIDFVEMPFQAIAGAVVRAEADCGLLIHEAQLMIERESLREVVDLGAWWQDQTAQPLPLGLNVIRRDIDGRYGPGSVQAVAATLARSVQYARDNADATRRFLIMRAIDRPEWTDEGLLSRYLSMYMSALTAEMGAAGAAALETLYARAHAANLIPGLPELDIQGMVKSR